MLNKEISGILFLAALLLEQRGINKGSAIHKASGAVDIWGAICLACGALPDRIEDSIVNAENYIPKANVGRAMAAYDLISSAVGRDASEWGDDADLLTVVQLLNHLASQSKISVLRNDS